MTGINLDAILGESAPRPLTYKTREFELPGELPASVLGGFIDPKVGLVDLITEVFKEDDTFDSLVEAAFEFLKKRPSLPSDLIAAAKTAMDELLGEQAEEFYALKPSVPAYFELAKGLFREYGMDLGDFFESAESLESDGESSKPTSSITTGVTPEASGSGPVIPASSVSADSES